MRFLLLLLLSSPALACAGDNWVYTKDRAYVYDADSVTRYGVFVAANVLTPDSGYITPVRADCERRAFVDTLSWNEAAHIRYLPRVKNGASLMEALCAPKWWEFWK